MRIAIEVPHFLGVDSMLNRGFSVQTDPDFLRELSIPDAELFQLHEWSHMASDLTAGGTRLSNRLLGQLWRYFLQLLELLQLVPTPA